MLMKCLVFSFYTATSAFYATSSSLVILIAALFFNLNIADGLTYLLFKYIIVNISWCLLQTL